MDSKQYQKFEDDFTFAVKSMYQQYRKMGLVTASYATTNPLVWDALFAGNGEWYMKFVTKSFKKLSDEEKVILKLQRPTLAFAKTWGDK